MNPDQQQRILGYFIEEAKDHLNTMEQGLLNLQNTLADQELINELFRAAHSVKGGAAMLGIRSIQHISHRLEDFFKVLKDSPNLQVDQQLESLLLRCFDPLNELLEHLQQPFGLTEDASTAALTEVEPVFNELQSHLDRLVASSSAEVLAPPVPVATPIAVVAATSAPVAQPQEELSALHLVFRSDITRKLREMLGLFKQPDSQENRAQLHSFCEELRALGEQFDLTGWCELCAACAEAVANTDNAYRNLAMVVIKELKLAQDQVLNGSQTEVTVSSQVQALLPVPVEPEPELELADLDRELLLAAELDLSMSEAEALIAGATEFTETELEPGFAVVQDELEFAVEAGDDLAAFEIAESVPESAARAEWESLSFDDEIVVAVPQRQEVNRYSPPSTPEVFEIDLSDAVEPASGSTEQAIGDDEPWNLLAGPRVGETELNSLAELFGSDNLELGDVWGNSGASTTENQAADEELADFSDLLESDLLDTDPSLDRQTSGDNILDQQLDAEALQAEALSALFENADPDLESLFAFEDTGSVGASSTDDLDYSLLEDLSEAPSDDPFTGPDFFEETQNQEAAGATRSTVDIAPDSLPPDIDTEFDSLFDAEPEAETIYEGWDLEEVDPWTGANDLSSIPPEAFTPTAGSDPVEVDNFSDFEAAGGFETALEGPEQSSVDEPADEPADEEAEWLDLLSSEANATSVEPFAEAGADELVNEETEPVSVPEADFSAFLDAETELDAETVQEDWNREDWNVEEADLWSNQLEAEIDQPEAEIDQLEVAVSELTNPLGTVLEENELAEVAPGEFSGDDDSEWLDLLSADTVLEPLNEETSPFGENEFSSSEGLDEVFLEDGDSSEAWLDLLSSDNSEDPFEAASTTEMTDESGASNGLDELGGEVLTEGDDSEWLSLLSPEFSEEVGPEVTSFGVEANSLTEASDDAMFLADDSDVEEVEEIEGLDLLFEATPDVDSVQEFDPFLGLEASEQDLSSLEDSSLASDDSEWLDLLTPQTAFEEQDTASIEESTEGNEAAIEELDLLLEPVSGFEQEQEPDAFLDLESSDQDTASMEESSEGSEAGVEGLDLLFATTPNLEEVPEPELEPLFGLETSEQTSASAVSSSESRDDSEWLDLLISDESDAAAIAGLTEASTEASTADPGPDELDFDDLFNDQPSESDAENTEAELDLADFMGELEASAANQDLMLLLEEPAGSDELDTDTDPFGFDASAPDWSSGATDQEQPDNASPDLLLTDEEEDASEFESAFETEASTAFPDFEVDTNLAEEEASDSVETIAGLVDFFGGAGDEFEAEFPEAETELDLGGTEDFQLTDSPFDLVENLAQDQQEFVEESSADELDSPLEELDELLAGDSEEASDALALMDANSSMVDTSLDVSLDDLGELDALLEDVPEDSLPDFVEPEPDFQELEALLGEVEQPDITRFAAAIPLMSMPVASTPVSVPQPDAQDEGEFADLEKMLEEADQTIGGPPTVTGTAWTRPGPASRMTTRRQTAGYGNQTMRVEVKHLDNLNNLVGELVVNRNSLEQDQDRLRQSLDNLLHQVQQLSDVGQRLQDQYERSLLESSLLASRQGQPSVPSFSERLGREVLPQSNHSMGANFDALEMDRFTSFHTLSQEIIELIVRVRESASDIEFIVDETEVVTRQFRQVTTQLQEGLTRSRMVPFAQIADRLPRAVRDIAIKAGKKANIEIEGRETLIDKAILEQLYDPMTHLVNNALTHGIEDPQTRQAAGKSPTGRIMVRAFHQGNQTVISVSDDGAGIDAKRVKDKAVEKRLLNSAQAASMTDLDVYDLLFHPGFSTADKVDDLKGRGVGMDVVRTSLNDIRGSIGTDSSLNKGTTFTIRLPLTLSISKAMVCVSNHARIAFPMDGVEDMLDVPRERVQTDLEGRPTIIWRDAPLPFCPLSDLLSYNRYLSRGSIYGAGQEEDIISVVILRSAGNFVAIAVDQVVGEQEIVIKQLEGPVPKPIGIAGATVLGDGRVMPIADVLELIDLATGRVRRETSQLWDNNVIVEEPKSVSEPTVLIVDDSITVRELLSMTFNKVGYRVEQARDGQEAWEKLRGGMPCNLVFCDIEMPRMDGLELLSRLQKDETLSQLPIAMLTSRGADRHRQMAVQLGASGYFTKPYLEEELLHAASRMLNGERLVS
ncbi:response regulator [Leptolyngbya sp. FACHB-261]|uniref:response regulator n=1 Tax=Leptolyngbya sp. FACHB-261 TaxID=2692806 RepID=UPI0016841094|nr:response regulator [Leptolyngbya sp. FACHB-261]MBD2105262.1 response regulator [Leptolyngbya sp. FACHB-261]